jgi:Kef-type K+ transport system membrane component KefB
MTVMFNNDRDQQAAVPPFASKGWARRMVLPIFYVLMTVGAVAVFLAIQAVGSSLTTAGSDVRSPTPLEAPPSTNLLMHVLLALAVIILTTRAMGAIFRFFHQPPVIGEIIGGIFLGPSILGRVLPNIQAYLLPPDIAPTLGVIAQLGVILFMFLIGLELNLKTLRSSGQAMLAISHVSISFPFLLGTLLALGIYERYATGAVGFTGFALFLGVAMAVTAFPVLARILTDRGLQKTRLGTMAIGVAAVDDVTAWCLLALVVSVVHAQMGSAFLTMGLTILFIAGILLLLRPLLIRVIPLLESRGRVSEGSIALIFIAVLLSALTTEFIGVHAIFGAFLLGSLIPHDSRVASEVTHRLEDIVKVMLLPVFFAYTGMRTEFGLLNTTEDWLFCGLIILVATIGKFGGTFVTAKLASLTTQEAATLGILMNTRGLVELVVLNIGLDLGVISPRLFAMLVLMVLITTFATTPVLDLLHRRHSWGMSGIAVPSESRHQL